MDADRAMKNVDLYHTLFSRLLFERNFVKLLKPQIEDYEPFLSGHALTDLLNEGTGPLTVHEFLNEATDDVKAIVENLEMVLVPLVDIFREHQLHEAYERLKHLTEMLQDGVVDY